MDWCYSASRRASSGILLKMGGGGGREWGSRYLWEELAACLVGGIFGKNKEHITHQQSHVDARQLVFLHTILLSCFVSYNERKMVTLISFLFILLYGL